MYTIWKRDEPIARGRSVWAQVSSQAGVRPGLRIALRALHRSEAPGLRRPRRGVGERSRDLFGRADDLPALAECAIGERAHGAGGAAAIDDSNTLACEHLAQAPCGGPILGVGGAARRAVHAYSPLDGLLGCFGHRFRRVVLAIPRL